MTDVDQSGRRSRLRSVKLHALVRDHLGHELDADPGRVPARRRADGRRRGVGARRGRPEPRPRAGAGLGPPQRRHVARRPRRARHRAAGPPRRRAPLPDRGLARRRPVAAAGRRRAAASPRAAADPPTSRSSTRSSPAAPCRSSSTASSPVRSAASRSAASSTTPHTGAVRLEVGVGAHDREAFAIMHGDVPTVDALAGVVRGGRRAPSSPAAPHHPLNRLAPERLLRWRLEQDPALLGLARRRDRPSRPCRARTSRTACRASASAGDADGRRSCSSAPSASTSTWSRTRSTPGPQRRGDAGRRGGRSGWSRRPATSCR